MLSYLSSFSQRCYSNQYIAVEKEPSEALDFLDLLVDLLVFTCTTKSSPPKPSALLSTCVLPGGHPGVVHGGVGEVELPQTHSDPAEEDPSQTEPEQSLTPTMLKM